MNDTLNKNLKSITNLELTGKVLKLLSYHVLLTCCEAAILKILVCNVDTHVSAEEISRKINDGTCSARSVVTHICTINQKAAPIISRQLILCKRGKGYIFNSQI